MDSGASDRERQPVMVRLHPGGFVWGAGADPAVDGEAPALQGVVLVTPTLINGRSSDLEE